MTRLIDEDNIKFILDKLDDYMETVEEDHPNPLGASHAKSKRDAYYNGIKAGLRTAQKCITGECYGRLD